MARLKILSTKKLDAPVLAMAAEKKIEVIEQAFISIRTVLTEETIRQIERAAGEKELAVAFTSSNAVEGVDAALKQFPGWRIFCLSGKTRQAIEQCGWQKNIVATAEDAATLADKIISHGVGKLVFFCGNRRKDTLPGKIAKAGIALEEMVVYENIASPQLFLEEVKGILFFSASAVESFFSVNRLATDVTCFAIGATTAEALKKATTNRIETSREPVQEAMMKLVIQTMVADH